MLGTLVSIGFWSIFGFMALAAFVFLVGTLLRNSQFGVARMHVDDLDEDPESDSYRIYAMSLASGTLAVCAVVVGIVLAASVVMAFVGTNLLSGACALAGSGVSMYVGGVLRDRHERLERGFKELSGMSVTDAYERALHYRPLPPIG